MLDATQSSDPLYLQLKRALQKQIHDGQYPPSSRLPSQVALSKQFAVSQITVQRAIQELTEEGLLEARPGSGTYVTGGDTADARAAGPRSVIGIVFQDVLGGYPLVKPLLTGIRKQCREAGYGISLLELPEQQTRQRDVYGALSDCAGVILASPIDVGVLAWLQQHDLPHVLLHNDVVDQRSYCISCNYASGVAQATVHLLDQGCRRVVLITAEETRYSAGQMEIGFRIAHQIRGQVVNEAHLIQSHYLPDKIEQIIEQWTQRDTLPDGLICASDELATAAIEVLQRAGRTVPDDVAVVGFGTTGQSARRMANLSTIDVRNEETGEKAMKVLQQVIEGKPPASHRHLTEPKLIVRESSTRRG